MSNVLIALLIGGTVLLVLTHLWVYWIGRRDEARDIYKTFEEEIQKMDKER